MIEDLDADYEAAARGLQRLGVTAPLVRCQGLKETEHFLHRCSQGGEGAVFPGVIILDLKLTDGSGGELLDRLGADPLFQEVPIIVWSAFSDPAQQELCSRRRGVSGCIRKTADRALNNRAMEHFALCWRQIALSTLTSLLPDGTPSPDP